MAVYVDKPIHCQCSEKWPFRFHSKMHADTTLELHQMARKLGLPIDWYHSGCIPPYYDIPYIRLKKAIAMGAIYLSPAETFRICREAWHRSEKDRLCG